MSRMSDQIIPNPFFATSNSDNCVECGLELDIRVQSPLLELSLEWLVELEANNLRWLGRAQPWVLTPN